MDDITLTFDPSPFQNGMKKINDSFDMIQNNIESSSGSISRAIDSAFNPFVTAQEKMKDPSIGTMPGKFKSIFMAIGAAGKEAFSSLSAYISKTMGESQEKVKDQSKKTTASVKKDSSMMSLSFMDIAKRVAGVAVAFAGIRAAMSAMPEIGRTFEIAGDIIKRNLFYPLRKELIPLLQQVLNWVRDNRTLFVRVGAGIANVFRVIFSIVKSVINIFKSMWKTMNSALESIVGKTRRSFEETFNILLFKITAIAQFLMLILEPLFDYLAKTIGNLIGFLSKFFSGFIDGLGDVSGPLTDIYNQVLRLFKGLGLTSGGVQELGKWFRIFGNIIGMVVVPVINIIAQTLDTIITTIAGLIKMIRIAKAWATNDKAEMRRAKSEMTDLMKGYHSRTQNRITGTIEHVKTSASKIKAEYNKPAGGTQNTTNNVNTNVNVTVTEGNAQNAGKKFAKGMNTGLTEKLKLQKAARGDG